MGSTWRPPSTDAALAAVLLLWECSAMGSQTAVALPAALLVTAPLAWRRRAPFATLLVVGAGFALQAAQSAPPETLAELVSFLLAVFTAASSLGGWRLAAAGAATVAAAVTEDGLAGWGDAGFTLTLAALAGGCGWAVRRRTRALTELTERTETIAAQAALAERERIARELHDVVSHGVSLMVVHAGAAEAQLDRDPAVAARSLRRVQEAGRDAVDDLRRMLAVLDTSSGGGPQPSLDDLEPLIADACAAGAATTLAVSGPAAHLPPGLSTSAYRVVQEGLTNARRHAPGATTRVEVRHERRSVEVVVTNTTPRGPSPGAGAGRGLTGVRERVAIYGGTAEAGPTPDGGWTLRAVFPVDGAPR